MRDFLIPLLSLLLGATITIVSTIFIERYRDRRSALSAALVIRDALSHIINVLGVAPETLRPLRALNARRFLDAWHDHSTALARSMSSADWQRVAAAFDSFSTLVLAAEKRWDELPAPGAKKLATAFLPNAMEQAKTGLRIIESTFDLTETHIPELPPDRDKILSAISPEFADFLREQHGEESPPFT